MANVVVICFLPLLMLLDTFPVSAQHLSVQAPPLQYEQTRLRRESPAPNFAHNNHEEFPHRAAARKPASLAETGWSLGPNGYQHVGAYWGHPTPTHWKRILERSDGVWPFLPPKQNAEAQNADPFFWKKPPHQQPGYSSTFSMMQQQEAPSRWQSPQPPRQGSIPQWFPFHQSPEQIQRARNRQNFVRPQWPLNADPGNWRNGEFSLTGWGKDSLLQEGQMKRREPVDENPGPAKSAYEEDPDDAYKEWFGPFLIDYSTHSLITDWNVVVNSPAETKGRGNLVVGEQNFVADATNSFISGYHNTARGEDISVVGGEDNTGEGAASVTVGGRKNVATGNYSVTGGGQSNQADGNFNVAAGGSENRAFGEFSTAGGGESNLAENTASTITGGKSNEATGTASAIHGGSSNKASQPMSTVSGGLGQETIGEGDHKFKILTAGDKAALSAGEE